MAVPVDLTKEDMSLISRLDVSSLPFLGLSSPYTIQNAELDEWKYVFLTDKSIYAWAGILAFWFQKRQRLPSFKEIEQRIETAVTRLKTRTSVSERLGVSTRPSELGLALSSFYRGGSPSPTRPTLLELQYLIEQEVDKLENTGLIKDPFVETFGGLSLMVAGVIPYSFTRRTEQGDREYLAVKSLLWEYERFRDKDKQIVEQHFRMLKAVEFLKERIRITWVGKNPPDEAS